MTLTLGVAPSFQFNPHQQAVLSALETNPHTLISHARQIGMTTALVEHAARRAEAYPGQTIAYLTGYVYLIRQISKRLHFPSTASSVCRLGNGSILMVRTPNARHLAGINFDLVIIDNASFVPHLRELTEALLPSLLRRSGRIAIATCTEGWSSDFHNLWHQPGWHLLTCG